MGVQSTDLSFSYFDHDLREARRLAAPCLQDRRCLFHRHRVGHRLVHRKPCGLKHADHVAKIFRLRIARSKDVEFLLHKEPRLVGHLLLRVADVDHPAGERDLVDRRAKGLRQPDRLNDHVGTAATGQLGKSARASLALVGVDGMRCAGFARGRELGVIQIDPDHGSSAKCRTCDSAQPHASASKHGHRVSAGARVPRATA